MKTRATQFATDSYGLDVLDGPDDEFEIVTASAPALPADVHIVYRSEQGASARVVTIRKIWRAEGVLFLQGICHLRNTVRTFRGDRIEALVCLATGEAPDNPAAWLEDHALMRGEIGPDHTAAALKAARYELLILAFLARSDFKFDPDELEVAIDYVMMSTLSPIDREVAGRYISRLSTTAVDIEACVHRVTRRDGQWQTLQRAMRRLVDADGEVTAEEQIAVERIMAARQAAEDAQAVAMEGEVTPEELELILRDIDMATAPKAGGWSAIAQWLKLKP